MEDAVLPTKIICLVLFGVISLTCGLLPLLIACAARSWRRRRAESTEASTSGGRVRVLLSCVLCLGGGVLLGTVFTHMLPEIRDLFLQIEGAELLPGMHPPSGEIFVCAGFFLVYLVEELVHAFLAGRASKKRCEAAPAPAVTQPSAYVVEVHGDRDAMSWHEKYAEPAPPPLPLPAVAARREHGPEEHEHEHGAGSHDHGAVVASLHALRAYIVIVALSVHSVFEGFAVAFETTRRDVWVLFAAIVTHKAIVAFCLGEQLVATKRSVCFVVCNLLILSAASPLGVAIGLVVERLDQDETSRLLATGLLQALAAGTILYVVFFEILAPERQKHGAGLLKFFAVVAGFALIVLMHSSGAGHSHGGPSHGLPAGHGGAGVHGHSHGDNHDHDHGHGEPVNSDYLARVPNESGHVYDTVRYIKSFSRPEPSTVDPGDIVAGMRSIVEDIGNGNRQDEHGEESHSEHGHGDEGGAEGTDEESGHSHTEEGGGQLRAQRLKDSHEHDHDEHDHHEQHVHSSDSGDVGSHAHAEGAHHHDHDQFVRTVKDFAGQLGAEMDPQAVNRTVTLMGTLDRIATQKTENVHGAGVKQITAGRPPPGGQPESGHERDRDHGQAGGHDHDHEHSQHHDMPRSGGAVPDARSATAGGDADRRWLHAAHFGEPADGHVQFVLQVPATDQSPVRDPRPAETTSPAPNTSTSAPFSTSSGVSERDWRRQEQEAERELDHMEEVRFHSHGDESHTQAPTSRPPASVPPATVR